jgi:transposase
VKGCGLKKTLFALEQARADVARRRRRWRSWQASLDPKRLVFIDETWIKTSMAPLRGWGPKGERLRGFAPQGHWRTLTFLGALRCDRLTAPCVFDGPINGECFRAYVEQQLLPVLKHGDIVVMDNLGSHKSAALRRLIKAAGARLWYLPPYSPDLNPIETGRPRKKSPRTARIFGKSPQIGENVEWMVADAVVGELVSKNRIPANRERNREKREIPV